MATNLDGELNGLAINFGSLQGVERLVQIVTTLITCLAAS